jgi:hypothetical protein
MRFSETAENMHAIASDELAGREALDALDILAEIRAGGHDDDDDSELDGFDGSALDGADDSHLYPDYVEHDCPPEFFGGE